MTIFNGKSNRQSLLAMGETMKHCFTMLTLAGIVFIGPNSEALLSNTSSYDMDDAGYHCSLGPQQSQINIVYKKHPMYLTSCDVTYLRNGKANTLWSNQRHQSTCETQAALLASRLVDRGWQCQTDGIERSL